MTPRHADVAYVLEDIAGVRGVFAVSTARYDFAVAVARGGGTLAEVHYALLRVLSYDEIKRVHLFHTDAPSFAQSSHPIVLTEMDRAAARARVPDPAPRAPIAALGKPLHQHYLRVLIVSDDRTLEPLVYEALDSRAMCTHAPDPIEAAKLASQARFDLVLCDASRAFGLDGLLARLTLERADQVIVVAEVHDVAAAHRRLQGEERLLVKPVTAKALRQRVLQRPALTMAVAAFAIAGTPPLPSDVLRILAITEDASLETAVRAAFADRPFTYLHHSEASTAAARNFEFDAHIIFCEARYLRRLPSRLDIGTVVIVPYGQEKNLPTHLRYTQRPFDPAAIRALFEFPPAEPVEHASPVFTPPLVPSATAPFTVVLVDVPEDVTEGLRRILPIESRYLTRADALLAPFHVAFVSAKAAMAEESVLSRANSKLIVLAPARDVAWVKHSLERDGHAKARVIALPVDDALLAREVYRDHPELVARVAIAESDPFPAPSKVAGRMRVLIVDDDITTQMLRAAAPPEHNVDVALATTAMEAFEHAVRTSVNVLVVSASMRSDGGEPIYRVLWRLAPELKARTVLVTSSDLGAPPRSVSNAHSRRIVSRPLTAQVVGRIVELYRDT